MRHPAPPRTAATQRGRSNWRTHAHTHTNKQFISPWTHKPEHPTSTKHQRAIPPNSHSGERREHLARAPDGRPTQVRADAARRRVTSRCAQRGTGSSTHRRGAGVGRRDRRSRAAGARALPAQARVPRRRLRVVLVQQEPVELERLAGRLDDVDVIVLPMRLVHVPGGVRHSNYTGGPVGDWSHS